MKATLDIVVRSTEIDVNDHVNNAKYLEYLEWGREEWYEQAGLFYDKFNEMGLQTVTVNIDITYRKECKQGNMLSIITSPLKIGRSSFAFKQEIYNQLGELCADALVSCVTIDVKTRKSREAPDLLRQLFSQSL